MPLWREAAPGREVPVPRAAGGKVRGPALSRYHRCLYAGSPRRTSHRFRVDAGGADPGAGGLSRFRTGRRLQTGGLLADRRLLPGSGRGERPAEAGRVRPLERRAADVRGLHLLAGEPGEAGSLAGDLAAPGARAGRGRGGAGTGARGAGDRLDRLRPALDRGRAGTARPGAGAPSRHRGKRRDPAHPRQRRPDAGPGDQPGRAGLGGGVVSRQCRHAL